MAQLQARQRVIQVLDDRGLTGVKEISFGGSGGQRGGEFRVSINYRYRLPVGNMPLLRPIFGGAVVRLEAQASHRIQLYKARWRW